jgi:hypothetical protein
MSDTTPRTGADLYRAVLHCLAMMPEAKQAAFWRLVATHPRSPVRELIETLEQLQANREWKKRGTVFVQGMSGLNAPKFPDLAGVAGTTPNELAEMKRLATDFTARGRAQEAHKRSRKSSQATIDRDERIYQLRSATPKYWSWRLLAEKFHISKSTAREAYENAEARHRAEQAQPGE